MSAALTVARQDITQPARNAFAPEQWALIKDTIAKDCNDAELALFLEVCASHQLNPLTKQIWVFKIKGVMTPVVARDGFIAIADRHTGKSWENVTGQYRGLTSNYIREHDFFDFEQDEREDGTIRFRVIHKPRDEQGNPSHGGADGMKRGALAGAWCIVRRRGHNDAFFHAEFATYWKGDKDNAWKTHPQAMIQKVAEATALRKAFPISGVIGEGEYERATARATDVEAGGGAEINWPEDEQLREDLTTAFRVLGYRRAKVRMRVNACTDEDAYRKLLAALNAEIAAQGSEPEEAIPDAEVVEP
jgi:phage recombination protein Bet